MSSQTSGPFSETATGVCCAKAAPIPVAARPAESPARIALRSSFTPSLFHCVIFILSGIYAAWVRSLSSRFPDAVANLFASEFAQHIVKASRRHAERARLRPRHQPGDEKTGNRTGGDLVLRQQLPNATGRQHGIAEVRRDQIGHKRQRVGLEPHI